MTVSVGDHSMGREMMDSIFLKVTYPVHTTKHRCWGEYWELCWLCVSVMWSFLCWTMRQRRESSESVTKQDSGYYYKPPGNWSYQPGGGYSCFSRIGSSSIQRPRVALISIYMCILQRQISDWLANWLFAKPCPFVVSHCYLTKLLELAWSPH